MNSAQIQVTHEHCKNTGEQVLQSNAECLVHSSTTPVVSSHCRRTGGEGIPAAPTMVGPLQHSQVGVPCCLSTGFAEPLASIAACSSQHLWAAYDAHA